MRQIVFLFCCLSTLLRAELIDRLAIVVGHQVVTEQQLDEELRVTAFLNHQPVTRNSAAYRAAADRLVQQTLIKREMEVSHYPLPDKAEIDQYWKGIAQQWGSDFSRALSTYDLTTETLKDHLALQLTTLRFIQYRFQPTIDVPAADILNRYEKEVADWKANHRGAPPSLEESRESIREALLEERTDRALAAWIEDARKRVPIRYLDPSLE